MYTGRIYGPYIRVVYVRVVCTALKGFALCVADRNPELLPHRLLTACLPVVPGDQWPGSRKSGPAGDVRRRRAAISCSPVWPTCPPPSRRRRPSVRPSASRILNHRFIPEYWLQQERLQDDPLCINSTCLSIKSPICYVALYVACSYDGFLSEVACHVSARKQATDPPFTPRRAVFCSSLDSILGRRQ